MMPEVLCLVVSFTKASYALKSLYLTHHRGDDFSVYTVKKPTRVGINWQRKMAARISEAAAAAEVATTAGKK